MNTPSSSSFYAAAVVVRSAYPDGRIRPTYLQNRFLFSQQSATTRVDAERESSGIREILHLQGVVHGVQDGEIAKSSWMYGLHSRQAQLKVSISSRARSASSHRDTTFTRCIDASTFMRLIEYACTTLSQIVLLRDNNHPRMICPCCCVMTMDIDKDKCFFCLSLSLSELVLLGDVGPETRQRRTLPSFHVCTSPEALVSVKDSRVFKELTILYRRSTGDGQMARCLGETVNPVQDLASIALVPMAKIREAHFTADRSWFMRNTVSHVYRDCAKTCGVVVRLESRNLTAHVAARLCWWSASFGLGTAERSTYRFSRIAVGFLSNMQKTTDITQHDSLVHVATPRTSRVEIFPKSLDRRRKADERFYCWLRTSQPRSAKGNEMVLHSVVDKTRGEKGRNRAGHHYILIMTVPESSNSTKIGATTIHHPRYTLFETQRRSQCIANKPGKRVCRGLSKLHAVRHFPITSPSLSSPTRLPSVSRPVLTSLSDTTLIFRTSHSLIVCFERGIDFLPPHSLQHSTYSIPTSSHDFDVVIAS
ncbi:hypothetical protein KCU92_g178, partial [Aureobasidium melanogenum]